jgi:putative heme transporter
LLAYVLSLALALVPVTPGGLGFVEAGLTSILVLAGVSSDQAVLGTLLYRLFAFWLPIPLGVLAWTGWRFTAGQRSGA